MTRKMTRLEDGTYRFTGDGEPTVEIDPTFGIDDDDDDNEEDEER
jgi:hypothetical protein